MSWNTINFIEKYAMLEEKNVYFLISKKCKYRNGTDFPCFWRCKIVSFVSVRALTIRLVEKKIAIIRYRCIMREKNHIRCSLWYRIVLTSQFNKYVKPHGDIFEPNATYSNLINMILVIFKLLFGSIPINVNKWSHYISLYLD